MLAHSRIRRRQGTTKAVSQEIVTLTCPGCGGRNEPEAKLCEWCGRPFVAQPRRIPVELLVLGGLGLLLLVLASVVIVVLVSFLGSQGTASQPIPAGMAPRAEAPLASEPPETPSPTPESTAPEFVRIANTGGAGAFIRQEPQANARGIVAHPDRTVLRIIGPDTVTDGRVWRSVEDRRGVRGWMLRDYLLPSDTGF